MYRNAWQARRNMEAASGDAKTFLQFNRSGNPLVRSIALYATGLQRPPSIGAPIKQAVNGNHRPGRRKHTHFWAYRDQPYHDFMAHAIKRDKSGLRPGSSVPPPK